MKWILFGALLLAIHPLALVLLPVVYAVEYTGSTQIASVAVETDDISAVQSTGCLWQFTLAVVIVIGVLLVLLAAVSGDCGTIWINEQMERCS